MVSEVSIVLITFPSATHSKFLFIKDAIGAGYDEPDIGVRYEYAPVEPAVL